MQSSRNQENASAEITVEKSPLVMGADLHDMLQRYLDTQIYGSIKPVLEGMGTIERPTDEPGQVTTYYTVSRPATLHLLNEVMGKEEVVKTYIFIRQGFESLIAAEQQRAAAQAAQAARTAEKSDKRIVELPVEDNIEQPTDEPTDEPTDN